MAATTTRMLQLLSLLQLHSYWHGPELAERLGVSERTLRRDIDRLRGLGYAIDSVRGVDGGYQMAVGSRIAPLTFAHDEAVALAIGLRDVAHGSDPSTAEASLRALAKLTATLPKTVREQIDLMAHVTEGPGPRMSADQPTAHVLGLVAQACRDGVRLRFDYSTHRDPRSVDPAPLSEREVEPYRLVQRGRRWYLLAFDMGRDDWRTFRVDRMTSPVCTRQTFAVRELPATNVAEYIADRLRGLRPEHRVWFTVDAPRSVVAPLVHHNGVTLTDLCDDRTRVEMTVEDLDWAMISLLRVDHPVSDLSPELALHVANRSALLQSLSPLPHLHQNES